MKSPPATPETNGVALMDRPMAWRLSGPLSDSSSPLPWPRNLMIFVFFFLSFLPQQSISVLFFFHFLGFIFEKKNTKQNEIRVDRLFDELALAD